MAAITDTPTRPALDNRKLFKPQWIVLAVILISLIFAFIAFILEVEDFVPVLQFWLVFVVIAGTITLLSLKQIRQARRWYGGDWWIAVISGLFLAGFMILAIIPDVVAPYGVDERIAPSSLPPGQEPPEYVLITRVELPYQSFEEIAYYPGTTIVVKNSEFRNVISIEEQSGAIIDQEKQNYRIINAVNVERAFRGVTPQEALNALSTANLTQGVRLLSWTMQKTLLLQDATWLRQQGRAIQFKSLELIATASRSSTLKRSPLVALIGERADFEPLLDNYQNLRVVSSIGPEYQQPLLGTNNIGQDVLSRLIYGTQSTILVGLLSAVVACLIGIPVGLISGYVGGFLDRVLSLVMDSLYSFPGLVLAIAIAAVLGKGISNVILAIAVIYVPIYYRIVRSQTLALREVAYVEAARSLGARDITILIRYIFPNVIASVVVIFSINVADAILTNAGLSFLGLGLPEQSPDWGVTLAANFEDMRSRSWLVIFPGVLITILVLCFSLLGESLSEILNPRLNRS